MKEKSKDDNDTLANVKTKLVDTVTELENERKLYLDSGDKVDAIETLKVEIKSLDWREVLLCYPIL